MSVTQYPQLLNNITEGELGLWASAMFESPQLTENLSENDEIEINSSMITHKRCMDRVCHG